MTLAAPCPLPRILIGIVLALPLIASGRPTLADPNAGPADEIALTGKAWRDMDYGPYLSLSLEVAKGNIVHKGLAVRLDPGPGGLARGTHFLVFDTDTLRWGAAWSGEGFINWRSILFDGSHGTHSRIVGSPVFITEPGPGYARPGTSSFEDVRFRGRDGVAYGPLERSWGHYRGLHLDGNRVVVEYTVGETEILEEPGVFLEEGDRAVFTRTLEIGPRAETLRMRVAWTGKQHLAIRAPESPESSGARLVWLVSRESAKKAEAPGSSEALVWDGKHSVELGGKLDLDLHEKDYTIAARVKTREKGGTIFARAPARGKWAPGGVTLFLRGGAPVVDMGWVGAVSSRKRIDDGKWHDVVTTHEASTHRIDIFVDGEKVGSGVLEPKDPGNGQVFRIGYTSTNFPSAQSGFRGEIAEVAVLQRRLAASEVGDGWRKNSDLEGLRGRWKPPEARGGRLANLAGKGQPGRVRTIRAEAPPAPTSPPAAFAVKGGPKGTSFRHGSSHLFLEIPAGDEPTRLTIFHAAASDTAAVEALEATVKRAGEPASLASIRKGGRPRWGEAVESKIETLPVGAASSHAVESLGTPLENPYRSWMRVGGFDFLDGGRRAAVCTWMGDVWLVDGIGEEAGEVRWSRFATGLYQPLGLKVRDGEIFVLGRDQITRLHDRNGDGEADHYESFHHDFQASEHFHEFAMDLQTDAEGNFYFMKGARHALDSNILHHGTLLRVSRDGKELSVVARGFRAPNGLWVEDDGTFITSDQEGHWTPANRINIVKEGGFYGYRFSYLEDVGVPEGYDPPLCWIDPEMDRSPAAQLRVSGDRWGLPEGTLLNLSYGTGKVYVILHEEVDGVHQGGVTPLPVGMFPTGIMRGRFHPESGQLHVGGLFGWAGNRPLAGGLYRIRYTGGEIAVPLGLNATEDGVRIRFSTPLDVRRSGDPRRFAVKRWNYKWQQRYGSDDWKLSDGQKGRDEVRVEAVEISPDGKTVFLKIPDMKPCMQMSITGRLTTASRQRLPLEIYHTIHRLGASSDGAKSDG